MEEEHTYNSTIRGNQCQTILSRHTPAQVQVWVTSTRHAVTGNRFNSYVGSRRFMKLREDAYEPTRVSWIRKVPKLREGGYEALVGEWGKAR